MHGEGKRGGPDLPDEVPILEGAKKKCKRKKKKKKEREPPSTFTAFVSKAGRTFPDQIDIHLVFWGPF